VLERPYSFQWQEHQPLWVYPNDPVNWTDVLGLQGDIDLSKDWSARVDKFNAGRGSSHEIHVFNSSGDEVGVFGPRGWINKHGFKSPPSSIPDNVANRLNGINVDLLRKQGLLPEKGFCDIKGGKYLKGGVGVLSFLPLILESIAASKQAQEEGISVWSIMLRDMVGEPGSTPGAI
jgi:hypothetical protein